MLEHLNDVVRRTAKRVLDTIYERLYLTPERAPTLACTFPWTLQARVIHTMFRHASVRFDTHALEPVEPPRSPDAPPNLPEAPRELGKAPNLRLRLGDDDLFDVFEQPYAIARYAAKFARRYPKDPLAALVVDTWIEEHALFWEPIHTLRRMESGTYGGWTPSDTQIREMRRWCADVFVPDALARIELHFSHHDYCGEFVAPTLADAYWSQTLRALRTGEILEGWNEDRMCDYVHLDHYLLRMERAF